MRSLALLTAMIAMLAPGDVLARSRGGSSRRSSPSRSRTTPTRTPTRTTAPKKKTWASPPKKTTTPTKSATRPKLSAADQKLRDRAKSSGTSYQSRSAALSAFKSKNASKYTSNYKTKPTTRPDHIPQTTTGSGGSTYNVTYNPGYGGYGYMGSSGSWIMYSAMADTMMMNSLMRRNNYYYEPAYMHQPGAPVAVVHHRSSGWTIFWVLAGICVFFLVVMAVVKSSRA